MKGAVEPIRPLLSPRVLRAALVGALLLAVVARWLAFSGFQGHDDATYAGLVMDLLHDGFSPAEIQHAYVFRLRLGLLGPVAGAVRLLGPSELAFHLYPLLLSLASVALAFAAARRMLGEHAAILAAFLAALVPLDVRSATELLPDLPSAFWAAAGMTLLFAGGRPPRPAARAGLGLAAGLALGGAWLCKESVAYLVPLALGIAVWRLVKHGDRALPAGLCVGGALVLGSESLAYWALTGDPLHRLHVMERTYTDMGAWFFGAGKPMGYTPGHLLRALLRRWLRDGPQALFLNSRLGYLPGVALLGVTWAVWRRRREMLFPGVWFLWLAGMYLFASSSLTAYRPLVLFDRYLYPLIFPSVLVTAGLLAGLGRRLVAAVLCAVLVLVCLRGVVRYVRQGPGSPVERQVAARCSPRQPLVTDSRSAGGLRRFWGFPSRDALVEFELNGTTPQVPPGALVLLNRPVVAWVCRTYKAKPPSFYDPVPADWTLVWHAHGGELYRVPVATP